MAGPGPPFDYAMRFYLQKLNPSAKVSQPFDNSSPNVREPLIQVASNALEMIDLIEDFDSYETELREFNHSV
jgi:hypothetical protein